MINLSPKRSEHAAIIGI